MHHDETVAAVARKLYRFSKRDVAEVLEALTRNNCERHRADFHHQSGAFLTRQSSIRSKSTAPPAEISPWMCGGTAILSVGAIIWCSAIGRGRHTEYFQEGSGRVCR